MAWVTLLWHFFPGPRRVAGPAPEVFSGWPLLTGVVYDRLSVFTPLNTLLLGGAIISAVINFVVTAHWLRAFTRPVLALCGAVLFTAYAWYGTTSPWAFTAWFCFCACLLPRKRPLGVVATLVLAALVSPGLLLLQLSVLICWFVGEWCADRARPKLVRATLNLPRKLRYRGWGWIAIGAVAGGGIAYAWWMATPTPLRGVADRSRAVYEAWGAAAGAELGMGRSSAWAGRFTTGRGGVGAGPVPKPG